MPASPVDPDAFLIEEDDQLLQEHLADEALAQELASEAWQDHLLEKARLEWEEEMLEDYIRHHEWNPYRPHSQD